MFIWLLHGFLGARTLVFMFARDYSNSWAIYKSSGSLLLQAPRILLALGCGEAEKREGLLPAWHLPYSASRGRNAGVAPKRAVDETEPAKPRHPETGCLVGSSLLTASPSPLANLSCGETPWSCVHW